MIDCGFCSLLAISPQYIPANLFSLEGVARRAFLCSQSCSFFPQEVVCLVSIARNFLTRPLTSTPRRAISPSEGLPILYTSMLGEWQRLPFTARIERPPFYRGGSASKKGTWPLPLHPSQAARCASTGEQQPAAFLLGYLYPPRFSAGWPGLVPHRAHRGSTF